MPRMVIKLRVLYQCTKCDESPNLGGREGERLRKRLMREILHYRFSAKSQASLYRSFELVSAEIISVTDNWQVIQF